MAGFITARDGVYALLTDTLVGTATGDIKVAYNYDVGFQTDGPTEGYPYATASPSFDRNEEAYVGTVQNRSETGITIRLYDLYQRTSASETSFLTLVDRILTTVRTDANLTLNNTVQMVRITRIKLGYNDPAEPTMRIAEIECAVTQLHAR